jgi:serine/threonine-protein kinase
MPGQIDRYEILEEIGQGGFAVVFKGRDTSLNRLVALKELRPVLLQDQEWVRRFHFEARTIAQLDHPHIVPIYDICHDDHRLIIVMRLAVGPSLEQLIAARAALPWAEALPIIRAIAAGLAYAHAHGVLHRDLKPANILIDQERGPMLSDFGLARLTTDPGYSSLGSTRSIVGTPNYIAPELWEGKSASVQSDIYALGCILYEMVTGQRLFNGQTPLAIMKAHFSAPSLPAAWPAAVPPDLTAFLSTALAETPARRFDSVAAFLSALEALPVSSPAASPKKI